MCADLLQFIRQPDWNKRVLILKPSSMGDIVHALPVLAALRRARPKAHISWVVRTELAGLFECVSGVDELILFDRRTMGRWWTAAGVRETAAFLRRLRQGRYDLVLDLQGLLRSGLFAWLSGCRVRLGLQEAREGARLFYTHTAPMPESAHIFDAYDALLKMLGMSIEPLEFGLRVGEQARQDADALLKAEGLAGRRYAVLAAGSAHGRKCWPAERFARVAACLHREAGLAAVLVGTAGERALAERIQQASGVPAAVLVGRTSIPQLAALLERAAIVIGNDTGPTHLAAALNVPTVMMFGPTNPARLFPRSGLCAIAAVNPWGRGRSIDNPQPEYRIENITVEQVLRAVQSLLKR
ncbi:MAG TPA: lipopolysaccharide heptosyltransferase I [Anaerohalosphaeraceae bacterium]|nr:lipopolysaccharide heptosyltransferase I [Anaerohalosphaeraceae bacterium]